MFKYLSSIGLSGIEGRKIKFNRMLKDASVFADFSFESKNNKSGRTQIESYKNLGDGFGVAVYCESYNKTNRKGEKQHRMNINSWSVFAKSDNPVTVADFYADIEDDGYVYAFCEDEETGNLFEFKMNNLLEYKKRLKKGDSVKRVNVALLALFGTIILPVYKDDYAVNSRMQENKLQRELLEKARSGDNEAEEELGKKALKMAKTVWERMKTEDMLSIFEGYFLYVGASRANFSVLADIEQVDYLKNDLTDETVVKLLLNITGTKLNLFINEKDLVGMPMVGMRFMGMGKLQGSAVF